MSEIHCDEQRRQHDGALLGEHGGGVEGGDRQPASAADSFRRPVDEQDAGRKRPGRGQELRLAHDVGDDLGVDGVDGKKHRAQQRPRRSGEPGEEHEHEERDARVQ